MKTCKSFVILMVFSTTLTAVVAKAESEAPLECKKTLLYGVMPGLECAVVSNNVEITDVILNRGRCTAPKAHTQKDIEALNEYRNKLEPSKRGLSFFDDGRPMVAFSERRPVFVGPQEYQEPAARVALDPRRKYEFGDTVNIALFDCDHLIEFTIEANGKNWTWKTH